MKTKGKRNTSSCELGLTEVQKALQKSGEELGFKKKLQGIRDKSYQVGTLCKCSSNHIIKDTQDKKLKTNKGFFFSFSFFF